MRHWLYLQSGVAAVDASSPVFRHLRHGSMGSFAFELEERAAAVALGASAGGAMSEMSEAREAGVVAPLRYMKHGFYTHKPSYHHIAPRTQQPQAREWPETLPVEVCNDDNLTVPSVLHQYDVRQHGKIPGTEEAACMWVEVDAASRHPSWRRP